MTDVLQIKRLQLLLSITLLFLSHVFISMTHNQLLFVSGNVVTINQPTML